MKKIKDLVPKEVRKRINKEVLEIYEDLYACEETINEEMERFEWLWEEEIKAEVKGVKPMPVFVVCHVERDNIWCEFSIKPQFVAILKGEMFHGTSKNSLPMW